MRHHYTFNFCLVQPDQIRRREVKSKGRSGSFSSNDILYVPCHTKDARHGAKLYLTMHLCHLSLPIQGQLVQESCNRARKVNKRRFPNRVKDIPWIDRNDTWHMAHLWIFAPRYGLLLVIICTFFSDRSVNNYRLILLFIFFFPFFGTWIVDCWGGNMFAELLSASEDKYLTFFLILSELVVE